MSKLFSLSSLLFYCLLLSLVPAVHAKKQNVNGFDISNLIIPYKQLIQGGPPRDGIPAIDAPDYLMADTATFMRDGDFVLGVVVEGQAFAYPLHILNWHELVNAKYQNTAFLVSYCPLCGTGMVFSANINNTQLSFGVSGLLYNSDLVFYDRETESLWSQLDALSISGPLVKQPLSMLPSSHTTWSAWLQQHPNTYVLSENQGYTRDYREDPYQGYENSNQLFFSVAATLPKTYHKKEKVLGVRIDGVAKAYPFIELQRYGQGRFTDTLAGQTINIFWDAKNKVALAKNSEDELMATTTAYWFAWYAFHPKTDVFKANRP